MVGLRSMLGTAETRQQYQPIPDVAASRPWRLDRPRCCEASPQRTDGVFPADLAKRKLDIDFRNASQVQVFRSRSPTPSPDLVVRAKRRISRDT